jgi:ribosome maturation factor RimP
MSDAIIERVTAMVTPLIADLKLDLYDIEFRGGVLRVTLDTPPGSPAGVDIDTLALVTRMISRDFDHDDPMPGHYTLEVTSPGLERTLRTPTHFQREIGKIVAIRLRDTGGAERRVQGTLVAATDTECTVRIEPDVAISKSAAKRLAAPAEPDERVIAYAQIDRAKTVFVWGPAPKPGKQPSTKPGRRAPATSSRSTSPGPHDEVDEVDELDTVDEESAAPTVPTSATQEAS